jgi:hypothetical protein
VGGHEIVAGRHQPEEGADSPEALAQAGIDQGYEEHIKEMRERRVPKTGTQLGSSFAYVLEAHQLENGNITALLLTPNAAQPFVSAIVTDTMKGEWMWGHYFDNVNEALSDYMERT